jgi:hypothetical protein
MRLLRCAILLGPVAVASGFAPQGGVVMARSNKMPLFMSYSIDGSEYSSIDSDYVDEDDFDNVKRYRGLADEEDDTPTVELQPVPMSKNSGNRFVALVWDRLLDTKGRDAMDLHYDRIALTEEHVMFCRKANMYNNEFNTQSMVDVPWSRQL